ncbi:hypothetical protein ILYODFUR_019395 [Ilyodon furcidens]|uniref:Uncharacterized protein n=1 Tax=Ilyodon furcidens TaxID=33524 RepID=A0ABV0SQ08_9TELE
MDPFTNLDQFTCYFRHLRLFNDYVSQKSIRALRQTIQHVLHLPAPQPAGDASMTRVSEAAAAEQHHRQQQHRISEQDPPTLHAASWADWKAAEVCATWL